MLQYNIPSGNIHAINIPPHSNHIYKYKMFDKVSKHGKYKKQFLFTFCFCYQFDFSIIIKCSNLTIFQLNDRDACAMAFVVPFGSLCKMQAPMPKELASFATIISSIGS